MQPLSFCNECRLKMTLSYFKMTVKAYVNCPALFQEKRLLQVRHYNHHTL